ncbi:uncharacterized protein LOC122086927 isoform X2 [Macadamia integrifolia]|uniref:uncharacterized protein LOC122086927 isoform X2 n=1 Tax=Macadamia integrifolia TaxID=60698 RepID=UPI001C50079D|nr:uncharacterized protein LOC122086927 isoform X2 [Macadamia integrifolia]
MADEAPQLESRTSEVSEEGNELEEVEKLEVEVKQMAQKIVHYRKTLPDQFKKSVASVLAAQRPLLPNLDATAQLGVTGDRVSDAGEHIESSKGTLVAEEDPEMKEKIRLLKLKISMTYS